MMTNNVDTSDGLVNCALGTLNVIQYATIKKTGLRILFDHPQTRSEARRMSWRYIRYFHIPPTLNCVDLIIRTIATQKTSNLRVQRKEFLVVPKEAITAHELQDATYITAVFHLKTRMPRYQL